MLGPGLSSVALVWFSFWSRGPCLVNLQTHDATAAENTKRNHACLTVEHCVVLKTNANRIAVAASLAVHPPCM